MELAALATRAVPGLSPTGVADAPDDARDFMAALVVDASGNRWRVRGPQHAKAAMRLETEVQVLRGFSTAIRAELPFRVPSVAGATRVGEMRVFVYNHLPGSSAELTRLSEAGSELIDDLGRTVAAVHDLSESVVDHAELPRYEAERLRLRRLNELDAAAGTGKVPPLLLRRWEHAMEDRDLWDFSPTVVHGDMHEDNLLIEGERVVAVTGWTDLHIGDPADDLAWLIASPAQEFSTAVVDAYRTHRRGETDEHILRRAALSAEFALAQWLVRGQSSENPQMTREALGLLNQLAADIETYGGRPIALTPPAGEEPRAPAEVQDSRPVLRAGAAATIADAAEGPGAESASTSSAPEAAGWLGADTDDEPAVITDADTLEDSTGKVTPFRPREAAEEKEPALPSRSELPDSEDSQDDPPTEEIPAYVEDHFADHPAPEPLEQGAQSRPDTGSLPIQPDGSVDKRAKQKNFFPASAASARSAQSAQSVESAQSAQSASSSSTGPSGTDESDNIARQTEGAGSPSASVESAESAAEPAADDAGSATADSIYSRHPGLRPPH